MRREEAPEPSLASTDHNRDGSGGDSKRQTKTSKREAVGTALHRNLVAALVRPLLSLSLKRLSQRSFAHFFRSCRHTQCFVSSSSSSSLLPLQIPVLLIYRHRQATQRCSSGIAVSSDSCPSSSPISSSSSSSLASSGTLCPSPSSAASGTASSSSSSSFAGGASETS